MADADLICAVCSGEFRGMAITDNHGSPIYRLCNDPRCAEIAKTWAERGQGSFTAYEREATDLAGRVAGKKLATGGVTDMARMSKDQWRAFIFDVVDNYRMELQRLVREGAPPF